MQPANPHALDSTELGAWLRLQLTPGIGSVHGCRLLKAFGLPAAVFSQSLSALRAIVPERQAQALMQTPADLAPCLRALLQWLDQGGGQHRLVTLGDPTYPASLLDIYDPPLMLYVKGSDAAWQRLPQAPCMAIVGSRIGGLSDVIDDGVNGLFCDLTSHAFAHSLRSILTDSDSLVRMRRASLSKALAFNLPDRVRDYEALLGAGASKLG